MSQKVEFIESYIKDGGDYKWDDNHGELVRCRDCKHCYIKVGFNDVTYNECKLNHTSVQDNDWYCADGERKDGEQNALGNG